MAGSEPGGMGGGVVGGGAGGGAGDWARYWRAAGAPVEAMHAHFTSHVYHRHSHESYSFGVTESGAQAFRCRHGQHVSSAGMVMAFNPDDPHDGHSASGGGFTYRMIHVGPEYFADLIAGATGRRAPAPLFRSPVLADPVLARSLLRLHAVLTGSGSELERSERLTETAWLLLRHAAPRLRGGIVPEPAARTAARIRELIHDSHATAAAAGLTANDLTADDIAAVAGCSRYAAYRAFTAAYGMAPSEYQRQLRIRTARGLLAAGVPAARAAAETGFADQAHLTRWFRRCYGVTPGAYHAAVRG